MHKISRFKWFLIFSLFIIDFIWFKWNKIKINNKNKRITNGRSHGFWFTLKTQCKHKKLGPFSKKCNFGHIWLLAILQKGSTWPMHNSLNFDPKEVFLDFFKILGCPLSNPFGLISIESSMFMYEAFTQKVFLLTFQKDL